MKMFISMLILFVFLLSSCASNDIDGQLKNISNNDFRSVPKVKYSQNQDYYSLKLMESDVLERETIARADRDILGGEAHRREDFLFKAIAYCYEGNFDAAREVFDSIYKKFMHNPSFWNHQGSCSFLEGNLSRANLYFLKALEISSKYTPAINNVGVIYQIRGDEQKAVAAFEKAIKGSKKTRTPRFNVARIFLKHGLASDARSSLWTLHKMNQNDDEVLGLLAISYLMEGKLSKSLKYFSKVSSARIKNADFGLNYTVLQHLLGMKSDAEHTFEKIDKKTIGAGQEYYRQVKNYIGI